MILLLFIYEFPFSDPGAMQHISSSEKILRSREVVPRDPVWVPETTRFKLVAAIIKIYATFGGSVFCSLLRPDSLSARSIALFIVGTSWIIFIASTSVAILISNSCQSGLLILFAVFIPYLYCLYLLLLKPSLIIKASTIF